MSAQIFENDIAEYAVTAWHRLGHVHGDVFMTPVNPWPEFERTDVYVKRSNPFSLDYPDYVQIPEVSAVVRTDDGTVVNPSVTKRFGIPDYSWMDEFAQAAKSEGLIEGYVSRGTLGHGSRAYASFLIGEPFDLGGGDLIKNMLTCFDGVDGSTGGGCKNTVERVVCANTWAAYLTKAPVMFSERHTSNYQGRIDMAWRGLLEVHAQQAELGSAIEQWANDLYAEHQFMELTKQLLGKRPEDKGRAQTMWDNKRQGLIGRYWNDDLDSGLRTTRLGALMAVQGYEQWSAPVRGAEREARHLDNLIFGEQKLTAKAAQLLAV